MINHVVWPTGVPPVPTVLWNQEDWNRFGLRFKPEDYDGGMFDQEAWEKYLKKKDFEFRKKFYASYGIEFLLKKK